MVNKRLQGEEQLHSEHYFLEVPFSHAKNAFEKCTTKPEFCNCKSYMKNMLIGSPYQDNQ